MEALWLHLEGEGHEQRRDASRQEMSYLSERVMADVDAALAGAVLTTTDTPDSRCRGCAGLARLCPTGERARLTGPGRDISMRGLALDGFSS